MAAVLQRAPAGRHTLATGSTIGAVGTFRGTDGGRDTVTNASGANPQRRRRNTTNKLLHASGSFQPTRFSNASSFDDASEQRVRAVGLEPTRSLEHGHLKPACLPITSRPRRADRTASLAARICRQDSVRWRYHAAKGAGSCGRLNSTKTCNASSRQGSTIVQSHANSAIPRTTVRDWRADPACGHQSQTDRRAEPSTRFEALPAAAVLLRAGSVSRRRVHFARRNES